MGIVEPRSDYVQWEKEIFAQREEGGGLMILGIVNFKIRNQNEADENTHGGKLAFWARSHDLTRVRRQTLV